MTLQDACSLAVAIDASGRAELITIGRFLPLDMITAESPWGCAVRQPDGTLQTVWSAQDWVDLQRIREPELPPPAAPLPKPLTPDPSPLSTGARGAVAEAAKIPRRDAEHLRQPSLF